MKTRILLMTILLGFICAAMKGQAPNWAWATSDYGTDNDFVSSVATDASGNVYITGYYYSYNIHIGSTILVNAGTVNLFVAKYNSSGTAQWARGAGGIKDDRANSIAVDALGNVYICGNFKSPSITFGTTTLHNSSLDTEDIFIAKYDASGNPVWAKSAGGITVDVASGVHTDAFGNVYMAGAFNSSSITFGSATLTNTGINCMYLVKYDSFGNALWAKQGGGTDQAWATAVSTDATGNIYVTGAYGSSDIYFNTLHLLHIACLDLFLVKYDSSGNALWAKNAGTCGLIHPNSLATDATGNVYLAGGYKSPSIIFESDTLFNADNSGFTYDIFFVKYDSSGNVIIAKGIGGTGDDEANSVAINSIGNIFLAGYFYSPSIAFDTTTLTSAGYSKIFLIKYDTSEHAAWAKTSVGTNNDKANSVATDAIGDVYVSGVFKGTAINFGAMTLLNIILNATTDDIFLAKINSPVTGIIENNDYNNEILISPNPFTTQTTLTIQGTYHNPSLFIYNLLGQEVRSIPIGTNQQITIQRNQLPTGMYFYKLIEENKEVLGVGKMIINGEL